MTSATSKLITELSKTDLISKGAESIPRRLEVIVNKSASSTLPSLADVSATPTPSVVGTQQNMRPMVTMGQDG
jgi:hypothetical protein